MNYPLGSEDSNYTLTNPYLSIQKNSWNYKQRTSAVKQIWTNLYERF
jgi:hypothetical protein